MRKRTRQIATLGLGALAGTLLMLCTFASTTLASSPLPASDYSVRAACPAPTPGRASCLSLRLVPQTTEARAHSHPLVAATAHAGSASEASEGDYGLTPSELHSAYRLPLTATGEQTIALVDAYNDPTAESDLGTYDEELGLPACTTANKCFKRVNQNGNAETANLPFPRTSAELDTAEGGTLEQREAAKEAKGWGAEISLDIETAHAICQNCHLILVEANSPEYSDLETAEKEAETLGANEISNSWGGPESGARSGGPFDDPKTVITAAAGDDGYLDWASVESFGEADFPASSPDVVAVGGTRLELSSPSGTWKSETVWNDGGESKGIPDGYGASGGGCSTIFEAQPWQSGVSDWEAVGCGSKRAVVDVAADGDPYSGVPVYYSRCEEENEAGETSPWCTYGGTSLASPIIAATYALAGGAHGVSYPAQTLYKNATGHPDSLHDVFSGSNGTCAKPFRGVSGCTTGEEARSCSAKAICLAHSGYDGPSGVGTPHGIDAFELSPEAETVAEKDEHKVEVERQEVLEAKESTEREKEANREREAKEEEEAKLREEAERNESEYEEILRIFESEGGSYGGTNRAHTGTSTPATTPPPAPAAAPFTPQLSALSLTLNALIALNAEHPRVTQVSFAFTLNFPTQVKVTLAKRVRVRKHVRWQTTRNSFTVAAKVGRTAGHLNGHGKLGPGAYRLTATPVHAAAKSITFQIG